jgi:hypothetical protein
LTLLLLGHAEELLLAFGHLKHEVS